MSQPGIACLVGKHLHVDVFDAHEGVLAANWCLWCGGAVYDGDRVSEDGEVLGFVPVFVVRVEPGWHRLPEDAA